MSRLAAQIEPADLEALIRKAGTNTDDGYFDIHKLCETGKINSDLSKIDFDFENCGFNVEDEFGIWVNMLGPRQIGQLTYIGFMAGGDWEWPIYFIIYLDQDGKTLRAYIPKMGNTWNQDTKTAIGNDEDADHKFLRKRLKKAKDDNIDHSDTEQLFNKLQINAEIAYRIEIADDGL